MNDEIEELCDLGVDLADAGSFAKALEAYESAWALLGEPAEAHEDSAWILGNIGYTRFLQGDYSQGRDDLARALSLPGGTENAFLHFRLGQCLYELGDHRRAGEQFRLAFDIEEEAIFVDEDPKYRALLD
ncbi:tetratricopeptide repeat protein [Paludisphaera rhizosphaerae]|uniref:tetratricopeptide repeat protein n=1 Tax=Paludisphaera rhizosphaerae TaxID=2711216 RepID=UPI0013EE038D|nr:tetratricopeptide repeat protein [Paludisphaera rhizosphaerae]